MKKLEFIGTIVAPDHSSANTLSVDDFIRTVHSDHFRDAVTLMRRMRLYHDYDDAHKVENTLPVFYPCGDFSGCNVGDDCEHNGLVVLTMHASSCHDTINALERLKSWRFVKAFFANSRGNVDVIAWVGADSVDDDEFHMRMNRLVNIVNGFLPNVRFTVSQRAVRGVLMSYDPYCFCRPDDEVEPFEA